MVSDDVSDTESVDRRAEGVTALKNKLLTVVEAIKRTQARIETLERERSEVNRQYSRSLELKTAIRMRKESTEDAIEKNEGKLVEMKARVLAKEQFVRECREFLRTEFVTLSTQENAMFLKEQKLASYKQQGSDMRAECQRMNAKKILLEEKIERLGRKEDQIGEKKERLRSRLESYGAEEIASSRRCSDSSDAASRSEQDCVEIEKDIEKMRKRTQSAVQRISALEGQVQRLESDLAATTFQRTAHEAMIREILISIQN